MKIGFFSSIEGWGGSETYLLSMMRGVKEAGHIPVLFGVANTRLFREAQLAGIESVAWKIGAYGGLHEAARTEHAIQPPLDSPMAIARRAVRLNKTRILSLLPSWIKFISGNVRETLALRRLVRRYPVDVMHVNVNGYEVAGLVCKLAGVPSLSWHCILPVWDPFWLRRWLIRWTNRQYDKYGGMSKTCIDRWREWCRLDNSRCCWAWNGIDVDRFEVPRDQGAPAAPFIILAVGRLHPMKGFDHLIRAIALLTRRDVVLRIAGEGDQEQMLRHLVSSLNLGDRVEFLGHIEDIKSLYGSASCFVLPSVSHESFGIVLAEAMASGLPVVTSDFGPLPEINVDGETGIVVPAGSPRALAAAISTLMESPELRMRYGQAGIARARECFTRESMVKTMLSIYESLAGRNRIVPSR